MGNFFCKRVLPLQLDHRVTSCCSTGSRSCLHSVSVSIILFFFKHDSAIHPMAATSVPAACSDTLIYSNLSLCSVLSACVCAMAMCSDKGTKCVCFVATKILVKSLVYRWPLLKYVGPLQRGKQNGFFLFEMHLMVFSCFLYFASQLFMTDSLVNRKGCSSKWRGGTEGWCLINRPKCDWQRCLGTNDAGGG